MALIHFWGFPEFPGFSIGLSERFLKLLKGFHGFSREEMLILCTMGSFSEPGLKIR